MRDLFPNSSRSCFGGSSARKGPVLNFCPQKSHHLGGLKYISVFFEVWGNLKGITFRRSIDDYIKFPI
jgi:hypothetical protein